MPPRHVVTSKTGRFGVLSATDGIHIVDLLGPAPRRILTARVACGPAIGGDRAWWIDDAAALWHTSLVEESSPPVCVPRLPALASMIATGDGVVIHGSGRAWHVAANGSPVEIEGLEGATVLALAGRRVIEAHGERVAIRTLGRRDAIGLPVTAGAPLGAAFVLAGRAVALWRRGATDDTLTVYTIGGQQVHVVTVPALTRCAFAEDANLAIATTAAEILAIDVRYGRVLATAPTPAVLDLDTDRLARQLVVATASDDGATRVECHTFDEIFHRRPQPAAAPEPVEAEPVEAPEAPAIAAMTEDAPALPDLLPLALVPQLAPFVLSEITDVEPYADGAAHLKAMLEVVAARAALAIAEGWHSGRRSFDTGNDLPSQREVLGLVGDNAGLAADELARAGVRLRERAMELRLRTQATIAAGVPLPFHDLAREHRLSPVATQILICAAAPRLQPRIGRLYEVLAGVDGRSACGDHLLEVLVETTADISHALARELGPSAPLIRAGLIVLVPRNERIETHVDGMLLDRLRGLHTRVEISDASRRRTASCRLEDVIAPVEIRAKVLRGLATRDDARPARIVLRGRRGSGRHCLLAAIAAEVDRDLAAIDATRLPRGPGLGAALATELTRAQLAGCIPMISDLESLSREDADVRRQLQTVLRNHPAPLAVCAMPESDLPIDPDHIEVELPALTLGERTTTWQRALAAHELPVLNDDALAMLAARFRFGPGIIFQVAEAVARDAQRATTSIDELIQQHARQHIAGRLSKVATRITRLADWDQVTLVDDMRDSILELIGRMRHQRTVFEDWGFERKITTARGLTAMFYGPPGTGKTMVAGLIGRELGLEVWRIDLARIMSKWIGETEKSLADVFAAAEEGQVLLLFDEADSLFGKRSEVKSSNDRYANLEVNYLLQRLDTFEGVAVLTTNLEGSIDPAFKRRLSMRLYFPFPDEELRAQLWAAHVPPSVPCGGALDFAELARKFPLSGGYIRNSALRAAFLAAQERRPLSQDHLLRAVQLEYRELGKLSTSGRMD